MKKVPICTRRLHCWKFILFYNLMNSTVAIFHHCQDDVFVSRINELSYSVFRHLQVTLLFVTLLKMFMLATCSEVVQKSLATCPLHPLPRVDCVIQLMA